MILAFALRLQQTTLARRVVHADDQLALPRIDLEALARLAPAGVIGDPRG